MTQPSGYSLAQYNTNQAPWWKQVAADEFTTPAPTGSWGTTQANTVVYTGDHGTQWREYPDGWPSTYTNGSPGYYPSKVLSVHDGVLDFNLANVNGFAAGANPSPILTGTSQYQTYGKYVIRAKFGAVSGYHVAFLLWPGNEANWQSAESDFPEFNLGAGSVNAFDHIGGGAQDAFNYRVDTTKWHTYEQLWKPTGRSYYVDGVLIGTGTQNVYSQPERWQLQLEPSGHAPGGSGHVLIDWIAVYSYTVV